MSCGQDKFTTDVYVVNGQIIDIDACSDDQFIDKAHGTVTITDGGKGYAKGCYYSRDNLNGTTTIFINEGDENSCDFNFFSGGTGGAGDVTASANIRDNAVVRGDGGAKGIQESIVDLDDAGNFLNALSYQAAAPTGSAFFRLLDNTTTNEPTINTYQGDPNTFITAEAGSLMLDQDGAAWINTDGTNTGWQMLMVGGGTVTGTGVAGQVAFWDSATNIAGDNDLFWDNTNTRLGIKTNTPTEDVSLLGDFHMTGHTVMGAYFNGFDLANTAYADRLLYLADNFTTNDARAIQTQIGFIPASAGNDFQIQHSRVGVSKLTFGYGDITGYRLELSSQNNSGGDSLTGFDAYMEHTPSGGTVGAMYGFRSEMQKTNALNDVSFMYGTYFVRPTITGISSTTQVFGNYVEDLSAMDGGAKYAFYYDFDGGTVINEDGLIGINTATPQSYLHIKGFNNNEFIRLETTADSVGIYSGTVTPNGAVSAERGSIFLVTDGTIFINTDGALAWSQLGTGGGGLTGTGSATQVAFFTTATNLGGSNNLWWDSTNSRLGIGTNAPATTLHLLGDGILDGHIALGENSTNPVTSTVLRVDENFASGGDGFLVILDSTFDPVAATDDHYMLATTLTIDDVNASAFGIVKGHETFLNSINVGGGTQMIGHHVLTQHGAGSGTITEVSGMKVQQSISMGGTVTSQYGFNYVAPGIPAGHTGTTYAFYSGTMEDAAGTNYAFYYDTALPTVIDAQGQIGINTDTPTAPLHVYNGVTDNVIMQRIEWNTADVGFWGGNIDPNGTVDITGDSGAGSLYFRANGTVYVNTDGAMAWTALGTGGGGITGSGVATRVAFWDTATSISSDADLYWDNTNKRLGINTVTPATLVEISGSTSEGLTLAGHMMLGTITAGSPVDPNAIIFVDEDFLSGFTANFIFQQSHIEPASGADLWVNIDTQVIVDDNATFGFDAVTGYQIILQNNNGIGGNTMYGGRFLVQQNGLTGSTVTDVYGIRSEVSIGTGGDATSVYGVRSDIEPPFTFSGTSYAFFAGSLEDESGTGYAFFYNASSPTVITAEGKLGIRVSNPNAYIQVDYSGFGDDAILERLQWATADIGFYGGSTNPNGSLDITGQSGAGSLYFDASAALLYINTDGATTWSAFSMGGNSGWTDDGAIVRLTTATDKVSIGTISSFGKLTVVGETNEIQLVIRANATQTASIFEVQDDVGATIVSLGAAGHWVPGTDDLQDLGADTFRWRDLYVGGATIHIGASTADEGMMIYTAGVLDFSTDATTNGNISFFTDDLYIDKTSGFIGINTTSPTKALHIAGASNDEFIRLGITGDTVGIFAGSADPSGSLTAEAGSLYLRSTGVLYINTTGATTWTTFSTGVAGSGANGQVAYWSGASVLSGESGFFWDTTNNRLGIGTDIPDYAIDVVLSTTSSTLGVFPSVRVNNTDIGGGHASFEVSVIESAFQVPVSAFLESVGSLTQAITGDQFGAAVGTRTNHPFFIAVNGSDLVMFDTNGQIGIGLADSITPSYRFQMLYNTSTPQGIVMDQSGSGDGIVGFEVSGVRNWTIGWDNDDADKFKIGQGALETDTGITITTGTTPNIGFRTQSPTYPLHLSFDSLVATLGTFPSLLIENTSISGNASIELHSNDTAFQSPNDVFIMSAGITASSTETGLEAGGAVGTRVNRPFFIATNNLDVARFDTNGTVGFGLADNTAPSYRLHVLYTTGTDDGFVIDQAGAGDGIIGFEASGTRKWTIGWDNDDADKFKIGRATLQTDTAITIMDTTNPKIGFNTDSPTHALHLYLSSLSSTLGVYPSLLIENPSVDGNASVELHSNDTAFQSPNDVFIMSAGITASATETGLEAGGAVGTRVNRPFFITINNNDLVRFDTTGRIGIGLADNTAPSYHLHMLYNTADAQGVVLDQAGAGDGIVGFEASGTRKWTIGWDNDDADKFKIGQASLDTDTAITIMNTTLPKIGFLNTTPTYPLHLTISNTSSTLGTFPSMMIDNPDIGGGQASYELDVRDTNFQNPVEVFFMANGQNTFSATGNSYGGVIGTRNDRAFFIATNNADVAVFNTNGRIGFGLGDTVMPSGMLDILQSGNTAAIPVLKLEQADVSEEFIRFVGTAADGNLTLSIVDAADVTTPTVVGYVKVYVQDDGNQISDQSYYQPVYSLA